MLTQILTTYLAQVLCFCLGDELVSKVLATWPEPDGRKVPNGGVLSGKTRDEKMRRREKQ